MKRLFTHILLLAALLAATLPLPTQAQKHTSAPSPLRFAEASHDFGTVEEAGGTVSHTFRFSNTSDAPVVIVDATSSCGCTRAEFSRKPVKAGESGTIVVHFDPTNYPAGVFSRKVTLFTSQGRLAEQLTIMGCVKPRPKSLAERYPLTVGGGVRLEANAHAFGYVEHGTPAQSAIGIVNDSDRAATLHLAPDTASGLLTLRYPSCLAPHESASINFGYLLADDCQKYGALRDVVAIEVNGKQSDYQLIISGIAIDSRERSADSGEPKVQLSENFYKFGTLKRTAMTQRHTITIYNIGDSPLHIRAIESERGIVEVGKPSHSTVAKGGKATVGITLNPERCSFGATTDRVRIVTDDRTRPVCSVRVSALIEK